MKGTPVTRAALPVLAWAALLTLLTAVLFVWTPDAELQWGPLAAAATGAWAVGVVALLRSARVPALPTERSFGGLVAAFGLVAVIAGALLGLWFSLVGVALVLAGVSMVLKERTS
jgi:hypothetical protein